MFRILNLNSCLCQAHFVSDLFPQGAVWVMSVLEHSFQFSQLFRRKCRSISSLLLARVKYITVEVYVKPAFDVFRRRRCERVVGIRGGATVVIRASIDIFVRPETGSWSDQCCLLYHITENAELFRFAPIVIHGSEVGRV